MCPVSGKTDNNTVKYMYSGSKKRTILTNVTGNLQNCSGRIIYCNKKVKQSLYTPWRRLGREEV
jgi:hypothetical protein